jgi:hypothetical protein
MPPQNRVWCHDGGNLTQDLPSQLVPAYRQATPVGIRELEPLLTQLASQDAVLLHQIRERLPLLAIQPAGEDGEHQVESRRVDHGGSLQHEPRIGSSAASAELWDSTGDSNPTILRSPVPQAKGSEGRSTPTPAIPHRC